MPETFKVGDSVKLKSGGPKMSVTQVGTDQLNRSLVWCVWFDEKNKRTEGTFPPETLEAA